MIQIVRHAGKMQYGVYNFVVDTVAEKEELLQRNIEQGSTVYVIESKQHFILNDQKAWVPYNSSSGGGGGGAANDIIYNVDGFADITNVKGALDKLFADVYYVAPAITSFSMVPASLEYEKGQSINSLAFSWSVNKDVTEQTLTDCVITATDRQANYNTSITSNKSFTLTVSDGENQASSTKAIKFYNKNYWGSAAAPTGDYDNAFILALSGKKFATSKNGTYGMTVADNEYGYIAIPDAYGVIQSANIGGFDTDLTDCGVVAFTNVSGYTENYHIFRTGQKGLGKISIVVG